MLAEILTDFPEKFSERSQLWLGCEDDSQPREYQLANHWFHKGRVVLKFEGVNSISDAEFLSGLLVQVPLEKRAELEEGKTYVADLVGSMVVDVLNGRRHEIGRIEDVRQDVGAAPLLVVLRAGEECEIPFAEEYLVRFDAARKILEMKLPPGLLKINAPLSEEEKQQR